MESHTLFQTFKKRLELVIEKHIDPSDILRLNEIMEELEFERYQRMEYMKTMGKEMVDSFAVPTSHKRIVESDHKREEKRKNQELVVNKAKHAIQKQAEYERVRSLSLQEYKRKRYKTTSYTTYEDSHHYGFENGTEFERLRIIEELKNYTDNEAINQIINELKGDRKVRTFVLNGKQSS